MSDSVIVKMGDIQSGVAPAVLETAGVGSCVAVVLYDPVSHVGGLAHAMLPQATPGTDAPARFVDAGIESLVAVMAAKGAQRGRLQAKLVGGAHMFTLFGDGESGIGARNVASAKAVLHRLDIPVAAEETGGTVGRNVRFDLSTGVCSVETKM